MEELYEFNIAYPSTEESPMITINKGSVEILKLHSKKEIKKATQQMLRTLLTLTQTLKVFSLSILYSPLLSSPTYCFSGSNTFSSPFILKPLPGF